MKEKEALETSIKSLTDVEKITPDTDDGENSASESNSDVGVSSWV